MLTNDNIAIIVPKGKFITENVFNWNDGKVRFRVPIGVAYVSDVRLVEKVLLEVAAARKDVMKNPPPTVRLIAFGDDALEFVFPGWSETQVHRRGVLKSAINSVICDKFCEHRNEILFL